MDEREVRFISEIVKPWELLNADLSKPFSMNPTINDFTTRAQALAVSIKHFPEAQSGAKIKELATQSRPYEVMSDLADSFKHGKLKKSGRQCKLLVGSMFERNPFAEVRFLRNRITVKHNAYGNFDFMQCSLEAAVFVLQNLRIQTNWSPKILNNSGMFSKKMKVHASKTNQEMWNGMQLELVEVNEKGEYVNIDLNGTVLFDLTSDF